MHFFRPGIPSLTLKVHGWVAQLSLAQTWGKSGQGSEVKDSLLARMGFRKVPAGHWL